MNIQEEKGMNWDLVLRGSTTVLLLGGFAAFVVEDVLGKAENRKKRLWIWGFGMILLVLVRFGMDQLEQAVQGLLFTDGVDRGLLGVIYSVIDNYISFLIPPVVVLVCTLIAYDSSRSVSVFISTFAGFWACVLHEYPFELMRLPFLGGDRGDGLRVRPVLWKNTLLLFLCMAIFYFLFHRYLREYFRKVIDQTNGDLRNFVLIPLFCSIVLMSLLSILSGNNIDITSVDANSMWMFILTVGVLILLFVLLYWSLFQGLTLSTQAMVQRAELDVATQIQKTVLPCTFPAFPERDEFDIYAVMEPAREVGGDFYDFYLVDEDHLAVTIADVSGKGVPAALFMMTARTLIKSLVLSKEPLDKVMTIANDRLCAGNETGMFVTVWLGVYEISTGKLLFVNAGHNPPLLLNNGEWCYLDHKTYKRGIMLGLREGIQYRLNEIVLSRESQILLYTDGITEATSMVKELFGEERLINCVNSNKKQTAEGLTQEVLKNVNEFVGQAEQFDDMTMLALQIRDIALKQ